MSKNHRAYVEARLALLAEERRHGATLDDVPQLIADYASPDEHVRAEALKRSCPCHVSWDVYEVLRKPALKLRRDPSAVVRALANHLEYDARVLRAHEAGMARYEDRDDDRRDRPPRTRRRARKR